MDVTDAQLFSAPVLEMGSLRIRTNNARPRVTGGARWIDPTTDQQIVGDYGFIIHNNSNLRLVTIDNTVRLAGARPVVIISQNPALEAIQGGGLIPSLEALWINGNGDAAASPLVLSGFRTLGYVANLSIQRNPNLISIAQGAGTADRSGLVGLVAVGQAAVCDNGTDFTNQEYVIRADGLIPELPPRTTDNYLVENRDSVGLHQTRYGTITCWPASDDAGAQTVSFPRGGVNEMPTGDELECRKARFWSYNVEDHAPDGLAANTTAVNTLISDARDGRFPATAAFGNENLRAAPVACVALVCMSETVAVTLSDDGERWLFDGEAGSSRSFLLGIGRYVLTGVPEDHPMRVLRSASGIAISGPPGAESVDVYFGAPHFWGTVYIDITGDFGMASLQVVDGNHRLGDAAYMGAQDIFTFTSECAGADIPAVCLPASVAVTTGGGAWLFGGEPIPTSGFLLGPGRYTLTDVPEAHPMARAEGGSGGFEFAGGTTTDNTHYYGTVLIDVTEDFGTESLVHMDHPGGSSYMGAENIFTFDVTCDNAPPVPPPVAIPGCDSTLTITDAATALSAKNMAGWETECRDIVFSGVGVTDAVIAMFDDLAYAKSITLTGTSVTSLAGRFGSLVGAQQNGDCDISIRNNALLTETGTYTVANWENLYSEAAFASLARPGAITITENATLERLLLPTITLALPACDITITDNGVLIDIVGLAGATELGALVIRDNNLTSTTPAATPDNQFPIAPTLTIEGLADVAKVASLLIQGNRNMQSIARIGTVMTLNDTPHGLASLRTVCGDLTINGNTSLDAYILLQGWNPDGDGNGAQTGTSRLCVAGAVSMQALPQPQLAQRVEQVFDGEVVYAALPPAADQTDCGCA
jgi:hypothetical protein